MKILTSLLIAVTPAMPPTAVETQSVPVTQIGTTADPSEGVNRRLKAKILVTSDLDAFWEAWEGPTPPNIVTTGRIRQAKPVFAIILFGGCTPSADGRCKLSVTFQMSSPDGSPYGKAATAAAYEGPAGGELLQASSASFGFRLEPQDKLGRYQMKAILTDEIARASVTVTEIVIAEPN